MNKLILTAAAALLGTLSAPIAAAQAAQPIELKGDVQLDKIVVENGRERHVLVEPKVVVPGDKLIFATAYRNTGSAAVSNFVVTNPIPAGVALAQGDAPMADVSVDGGKTWGKLASLTVTGKDGVKRAAQSSDVTHIRWTLASVAPGASGTLSYHAVVR
ncbi:MAG: hypothetical protein ACKOOL_03490 [Novosphingobium sp.]